MSTPAPTPAPTSERLFPDPDELAREREHVDPGFRAAFLHALAKSVGDMIRQAHVEQRRTSVILSQLDVLNHLKTFKHEQGCSVDVAQLALLVPFDTVYNYLEEALHKESWRYTIWRISGVLALTISWA